MCYGCWAEAGSPAIDTPQVREAARLIGLVYTFSDLGGGLHVYVDDYNLDDDDMPVERYTGADNDKSTEQIAAEEACAIALNGLTLSERYAAVALQHGAWSVAAQADR